MMFLPMHSSRQSTEFERLYWKSVKLLRSSGCAPDQGSGRILCTGVARPEGSHVAATRLGEEVLRRSTAFLSWQRADEARAARDRAAQARSGEAKGGARH